MSGQTNHPEIEICGRKVGINYPPFCIAEIGINHEGDVNKAIQMIDDAFESGCECVKFQSHICDDEMAGAAANVIPGNADVSIKTIMERCALTAEEEKRVKDYVESKGMIYLCTPFSRASADRLIELGVEAFKIGSGECNNYPLVKHIASFGKPIIMSTGMNNIESVAKSVEIFREHKTPFALFQCTSMYPTPYNKVHLGGITSLREAFPDAVVGLSDHSLGNWTCYGAVSYGASIFEKHFTSDKTWPGPDIEISIDPRELGELVVGTKAVWEAQGGSKQILSEEQVTIDFAYACVVTIADIKAGDVFTKENIWVKRPGTGEILAVHYEDVLGKTATVDIANDEQVKVSDVNDFTIDQ